MKPRVGVLVMALLEGDCNRTARTRPKARAVADKIAGIIGTYPETICPPLGESVSQAEAAACEPRDLGIVAV